MKRCILIAFCLLVCATTVFASTLQIGPSFAYNKTAMDIVNEESASQLMTNLSFGADFRVNVANFQLSVQSAIGGAVAGADAITLNTNVTGNINWSFSIFDAFIGLGANMDFAYLKNESKWRLNGFSFDGFLDALGKSSLIYRAGLGVEFGAVGLSFQFVVPTGWVFSEKFDILPKWEETKLMASVLFNFF